MGSNLRENGQRNLKMIDLMYSVWGNNVFSESKRDLNDSEINWCHNLMISLIYFLIEACFVLGEKKYKMVIKILAEAKLNRNELIKDLSTVVVKHHWYELQLTISGVKEKGKCPKPDILNFIFKKLHLHFVRVCQRRR